MVEDGRQVPRSRRGIRRYSWLALLVPVSLSLGVALVWRGAEPPAIPVISSPQAERPITARRETRPTLDPAKFVGKAAAAHRVAREIPEVLDQLYCYCGCDKHEGHKSLLSCYTDGHAAT